MTEQEIINGCKKQKPECQKQLVLRYSSLLLGVCHRYMGRRAQAKDILQESFLMIFRYLPDYKTTGSFTAWMKRIVATTALQHLRKSPYKQEQPGLEEIPEDFVAPEVYAQLAAEDLIEMIEDLPEGFRTVFNLNAIEGYSHKEIADLLDITESTSRSQLARARRLLKQKIENQKKTFFKQTRRLSENKKNVI